jgi:hypothetical protein
MVDTATTSEVKALASSISAQASSIASKVADTLGLSSSNKGTALVLGATGM